MKENHIFVDTNVLIGYFVKQKKDVDALNYIFSLKGKGLYTSSLAIAQTVSVLQKKQPNQIIEKFITYLMGKFKIISFVDEDIKTALRIKTSDIKDSMQYAMAKKLKCFYVVTNNIKDYSSFVDIAVLPPSQIRKIER